MLIHSQSITFLYKLEISNRDPNGRLKIGLQEDPGDSRQRVSKPAAHLDQKLPPTEG